ncbi:MAG: hypothetical protein ACE5QF_04040 [Thermoplasmata archaeon]
MPSRRGEFLERIGAHKRMVIYGTALVLLIAFVAFLTSAEADPCVDCHEAVGVLSGITDDWGNSEHAEENVTCIDCHEASVSDPDALSHN